MPSIADQYIVIVRDASGELYEFNRATHIAWEYYENDVGRCRFFVPYNDLKLSTTSVPDNAYSEILIYRDGSLVWHGITQIVQDTTEGVWVYGETFMAALSWYGVRYNQEYINEAVGNIVENEYDNIVARTGNFLTSKVTKGTIEDPYISGTTTNLTTTRTLFHENFLSFLKQMVLTSKAENTSSWNQNSVFNISFSATAPTFTFLRDVGENKSDVVFELNSEIVDFNIPKDLRGITNYVKGLAIASGPVVLNSEEQDSTSRGTWYRREFYPFFNSVTAQDDLSQRTADFLRDRKDPRRDMTIKFAAGLAPFDGYVMGDSVRIKIKMGRTDIDEFRRVIGMEASIDSAGVEQITPILQEAVS